MYDEIGPGFMSLVPDNSRVLTILCYALAEHVSLRGIAETLPHYPLFVSTPPP